MNVHKGLPNVRKVQVVLIYQDLTSATARRTSAEMDISVQLQVRKVIRLSPKCHMATILFLFCLHVNCPSLNNPFRLVYFVFAVQTTLCYSGELFPSHVHACAEFMKRQRTNSI